MSNTVERIREKIASWRLHLNWRWLQLRASFCRSPSEDCPPSLVLVPCEPWSVIGSRGDEAMVYSILRDFRSRHPEGSVTIVTGVPSFGETDDGKRLAHNFGAKFAYAWRPRLFLSYIVQAYREARATEVFVLGADCMDGHWSQSLSIILLAAADIAARMGISTRLTGFSWNDCPDKKVIRAFRRVTHKLPVLVRDPVSYERFRRDVLLARGVKTSLVADVAFNLRPSITSQVQPHLDWMEEQRAKGRFVLGFNLHSMLVKKDALPEFVATVTAQLGRCMADHQDVALLLVPHDYRTEGDLTVLEKVADGLAEVSDRVRLVTTVLAAEELKGLMKGVDALFTSRMHLGIAALGMSRPVAAFAYQGKFVGLFRHFQLPAEWILEPGEANRVSETLGELVAGAQRAARQIEERLPAIGDLARENLLA